MAEHDETHEATNQSFLDTAIAHSLLGEKEAEEAREHADRHGMALVDAVLTLSMMEPAKVDAARILSKPLEFVPGYELNGLIGCGASGNVFRAKQMGLQRQVALKSIKSNAPETFQARMQREAEAIARLQHPNIVVAYESGFSQGRFYIVMELVEGGTVSDFISHMQTTRELSTATLNLQTSCWRLHRPVGPCRHPCHS